jgi:hypothetical protein
MNATKHTPIVERTLHKGAQKVYRFGNSYGASVVRHEYSYGSEHGKWELAVIKFGSDDNDDWSLTYETPIAEDVIGYLDESEVNGLLGHIAALTK